MKAVVLFGSPRSRGNTRALLDHMLPAMEEAGAVVEFVDLNELGNMTGCRECYGCQKVLDEPGCVVKDDLQPVLAKVFAADVLLLATPVFCWSMSWLLKMAVDRLYCMFKFGDGEIRCLLEGRVLAGVVTAGGEEEGNADIVPESFKRLAEFGSCLYAGCLVAANVESAESIVADERLGERAREFGQELVRMSS